MALIPNFFDSNIPGPSSTMLFNSGGRNANFLRVDVIPSQPNIVFRDVIHPQWALDTARIMSHWLTIAKDFMSSSHLNPALGRWRFSLIGRIANPQNIPAQQVPAGGVGGGVWRTLLPVTRLPYPDTPPAAYGFNNVLLQPGQPLPTVRGDYSVELLAAWLIMHMPARGHGLPGSDGNAAQTYAAGYDLYRLMIFPGNTTIDPIWMQGTQTFVNTGAYPPLLVPHLFPISIHLFTVGIFQMVPWGQLLNTGPTRNGALFANHPIEWALYTWNGTQNPPLWYTFSIW